MEPSPSASAADLSISPVSSPEPLSPTPASRGPPPLKPLHVTVHISSGLTRETIILGRKPTSTIGALVTHVHRVLHHHSTFSYLVHRCSEGDPATPTSAPLPPATALCEAVEDNGHLLLVRSALWAHFPCGLAPDLRVYLDLGSSLVVDLKEALAAQLGLRTFCATYRLHLYDPAASLISPEPLPESAPLAALATGSWLAALPVAAPQRHFALTLAAQPWPGHAAPVRAIAALPAASSSSSSSDPSPTPAPLPLVVSGDSQGALKAWLPGTATCAVTLPLTRLPQHAPASAAEAEVNALAALKNGSLAVGSADGYVRVLHLHATTLAATLLSIFPGHDHSGPSCVRALLALPPPEPSPFAAAAAAATSGAGAGAAPTPAAPPCRLAVGSGCKAIRVFRVHHGEGTVREAGGWLRQGASPLGVLRGHEAEVLCLAALPGERMASGSADGTIRVWSTRFEEPSSSSSSSGSSSSSNTSSGAFMASLLTSPARSSSTATLSATPASLAATAASASGLCLAVLRGCEGWVGALATLPSSGLLVSGDASGSLRVWDTLVVVGPRAVGGCLRVLRDGGGGGVAALAVVRGGRVASGGYGGGGVRLWDCEAGVCVGVAGEEEGGGGGRGAAATHALCALQDGRLLCGKEDARIHVLR